jgi:lipopolysaccharide/colanic/teichoic acid biosynthesis glycosyltransferase
MSTCTDVGVQPLAAKRTTSEAVTGLRVEPAQRNAALHRIWDAAASLILLVLALPFLLLIAVAVGTTSSGGVLYRQVRVGQHGREFVLLKFRSMFDGVHERRAELAALNEGNGLLFKIRRDPRVTPVGRFLRRFSLDELPQLLNVFRGDMSLVGPRPALPEEVALYGAEERQRLLTKPGITGLWQVSGRSDLPWDDSVRLDLQYVHTTSFLLDVKILLRTVLAVVHGRGAY